MLCRRGFSLIELMIVVAIVSIIATIAIPILLSSRQRAMDDRARHCIRNIVSAEIAYYTRTGSYGTLDALANAVPPFLDERFASGVGILEFQLRIHLELGASGSAFRVYTDNPGGRHNYESNETFAIQEL